MSDDADRLKAVAEACKALGMTVGALKVGDIEVRLAQPWGVEAKPSKRAQARAEATAGLSDEDKALMEAGRKQFGRNLPLAKLKAMKGAILGFS